MFSRPADKYTNSIENKNARNGRMQLSKGIVSWHAAVFPFFFFFFLKLTSVRALAVEKNRNAANGVVWGFLSFLQYAFEIEMKTLPS